MRCRVSAAAMPLVAVVCVSVADVVGERVAEGVPVEVVGVADDELASERRSGTRPG
jgi:hypothetical protein